MLKKINESFESNFNYEIVEAEGKKPKWIIKGSFAKANYPTRNNNIYTTETLNNAVSKIKPRVEALKMRMLIDHPDGLFQMPKLKLAAAQLIEITDVQEDGYCYYKAKILDNENGEILKSILKEGGKIGVSTRGRGAGVENEFPPFAGTFNIIENFSLDSIDFVDDPAVLETEDTMKLESKQNVQSEHDLKESDNKEINRSDEDMLKTISEFKEKYPEIATQYESEISKNYDGVKSFVESVVEKIKSTKPEAFEVIPESKVIEAKNKELLDKVSEINSLNESLKASKEKIAELEKVVEGFEAEKNRMLKENKIASLKAEHPDFMGKEFMKTAFESCINVEDVVHVFESRKKMYDEMKVSSEVKLPKTESTSQNTDNELTVEETKMFNVLNLQRQAIGLKKLTVAEFISETK